jgi:type I site-specific restriction endonuclease
MDKPMRQSPTSTANIAYMLGEMTALIKSQAERSDQLARQVLARLDKIDEWREIADNKMASSAQNYAHMTARIDRIEHERHDDIEDAIRTVIQQSLRDELKAAAIVADKKESEGQSITFKYLVDKLMIPVLSSVISAIVTGALIYYLVSGG